MVAAARSCEVNAGAKTRSGAAYERIFKARRTGRAGGCCGPCGRSSVSVPESKPDSQSSTTDSSSSADEHVASTGISPSEVKPHVGQVQSTKLTGDWDVVEVAEDVKVDGGPQTSTGDRSLLGPPARMFEAALAGFMSSGEKLPSDLHRQPLIKGLEELAAALDHMGDQLGSYIETNVKKLHASKAVQSHDGYRAWLQSELPVHKKTGYKSFVDESAWMANLWLGWTLEFFVEFFSELREGRPTPEAVDAAYNRTLYNHHNWFQRTAFGVAMKKMPERRKLLLSLRTGEGATENDVIEDLGRFVKAGRPVADFCSVVSSELEGMMQKERGR